jgi:hypothetical protein
MFVGSLLATVKFTTATAPSVILPDPISVRLLKAMLCPVFVRTAPLFTIRAADAVTVEAMETVPLMERL